MKLREGLMLRYVDGMPIVVPIGATAVSFNGMIRLNESGAFLWEQLASGADEATLVKALEAEYQVSAAEAAADVQAFLAPLKKAGFLEE